MFRTLLLTSLLSLSVLPASAGEYTERGWDVVCPKYGNTIILEGCRQKTPAERAQDRRLDRMYQEAFDEVMSNYNPMSDPGCQGCTGGPFVPLDMSTVNQGYSTTIESTGAGMPTVSPRR